MTNVFHVDNLFLSLLQLSFLNVFFIHIASLGLANQLVAREFLVVSSNFSFFVVIVDVDHLFVQVELCLLNLGFGGEVGVKFETLGHLVENNFLASVILLQN